MTDTAGSLNHPHEIECLGDTGKLAPHDLTVDTYHCEGCHQRAHRAFEQVVTDKVTYDVGSDTPVIHAADPYAAYPRFLMIYHGANGFCSLMKAS